MLFWAIRCSTTCIEFSVVSRFCMLQWTSRRRSQRGSGSRASGTPAGSRTVKPRGALGACLCMAPSWSAGQSECSCEPSHETKHMGYTTCSAIHITMQSEHDHVVWQTQLLCSAMSRRSSALYSQTRPSHTKKLFLCYAWCLHVIVKLYSCLH